MSNLKTKQHHYSHPRCCHRSHFSLSLCNLFEDTWLVRGRACVDVSSIHVQRDCLRLQWLIAPMNNGEIYHAIKVDSPLTLLLFLLGHLHLSSAWLRVNRIPNRHAIGWERTTCSKYDSHSRFNCPHNWENLFDNLMNVRIFIVMMHTSFKTYEESDYNLNMDLLTISY